MVEDRDEEQMANSRALFIHLLEDIQEAVDAGVSNDLIEQDLIEVLKHLWFDEILE